MRTYENIGQVKKDIKDGILAVDDDIEIGFDGFDIKADIKCKNITCKEYRRNISAGDISAGDISAWDISAWDISAWDISAGNISAGNISAWNISYYAVCYVYENIICKSITGRREKHKHFCIDGEITINKKSKQEGGRR